MSSIRLTDLHVAFPLFVGKQQFLLTRWLAGQGRAQETPHIVALKHINLEIGAGERVAIMGANGSGKTTLLRALLGVYPPTSGHIMVEGKVSSMISLNLGFDVEATGRENIFIRATVMGLSRKQILRHIDDIVDFAGLGEFMDYPLRTYSSGMVMRLSFAIATAIPADVIILDEWLSVGDAEFQTRAEARLNDYISQAKILVFATHNTELANRLCTRKITLSNGQIVEDVKIIKEELHEK